MDRQKKQKFYTPKEALIKAAAYCAYQERTQQEVRTKLFSYGLEPDDVEELIVRLSQEKMLDEERYAQAYVRGKYSLKKWGRRKITQGLKAKGISDYCIKQGLKEIDPEVYEQNLLNLLEKKNLTEKEKNPFTRRQKLSYFLLSKGYENDLVQDALKGLENEK
ncbi:regulatory protein RecX [Pontibacter vulgaris]|uniref:regulatory protein RecX n=1 Tax=Pontibacter vulgaris TaxID=2905679 RepID=UPI001FA6DA07|nr:regulatory protein RecX [Pontibacter vulgaris]